MQNHEEEKEESEERDSEKEEPEKKLNMAKLKKLKKKAKVDTNKQSEFVCKTCKEEFQSKTKLFNHLKQSKHESFIKIKWLFIKISLFGNYLLTQT